MKKAHEAQLANGEGAKVWRKEDTHSVTECIESLHNITAILAFLDYMYNPTKAKNNAHMDNIARKGGREIFSNIRQRMRKVVQNLNDLRVKYN